MLLNFPENDIGIYKLLPNPWKYYKYFERIFDPQFENCHIISVEKGKVLVRGEQSGSRGIAPLILTSVKEGSEWPTSNTWPLYPVVRTAGTHYK